jgi:hypothetical protein
MYVSAGQAGIMVLFGVGLLFGAVLLGVTAYTLRVGSALGVSLVVGIVLIVWIGVGFIANAIAMRRSPVFELFSDRLVCHDLEGTYEVALGAIERATVDERRGIAALVVEAEGRRIVIPASLTDSDRVFESLFAAAAHRSPSAGGEDEVARD